MRRSRKQVRLLHYVAITILQMLRYNVPRIVFMHYGMEETWTEIMTRNSRFDDYMFSTVL